MSPNRKYKNLMRRQESIAKSLHDWRHAEVEKFLVQVRSDKTFLMEAVKQNGYALFYSSKELQSDKEVALAAVNQNGWVLKHLSQELKSDKEIVLAAIQNQCDWALDYSSDDIQTLCKGKDAIKALESAILAEKLAPELQHKARTTKLKI